jgi:hypothetical protein
MDCERQAEVRCVYEKEVLRGLHSGDGLALTKSDWKAIRDQVTRRSVERNQDAR